MSQFHGFFVSTCELVREMDHRNPPYSNKIEGIKYTFLMKFHFAISFKLEGVLHPDFGTFLVGGNIFDFFGRALLQLNIIGSYKFHFFIEKSLKYIIFYH